MRGQKHIIALGTGLAFLASCGGDDGGATFDRAPWIGVHDVAWSCQPSPCAVTPDVTVSTTATVVADPQSDDRINISFMPAPNAFGIVAMAVPAGASEDYQITQLFDANGAWTAMRLVRTGTGFTGDGMFITADGDTTDWALVATRAP